MNAVHPLPLGTVAAAEFRRRQTRARTIVANRGMSAAQATAHLRPWLAIACLCGAKLPEIDGWIADVRDDARFPISEGEARWLVAEEICPRPHWIMLLAAARDTALDRAAAAPGDEASATAGALQRICIALAHDANGHHLPVYQPAAAKAVAA